MYLIITFHQFLFFIVATNKKMYRDTNYCDFTRDRFFIFPQIIHYETNLLSFFQDSFFQDKDER